jgi:glycosyltransferase involved in cell wall biosynthesis
MAPPDLSILIPTIRCTDERTCRPGCQRCRRHFLEKLLATLTPQVQAANNGHVRVEILTCTDDGERSARNPRGTGLPIGIKRNRLVEQAQGRFVAFVDDDDQLSGDYVAKILRALDETPDATHCGIEGVMTWDGQNATRFVCSLANGPIWREPIINRVKVYLRPPNHLCPIKREIALRAPFPPKSFAEDKAYADAVFPMLRREARVPGAIYFYLYRKK